MIDKGSWVQIRRVVLAPKERPETLPEETRRVPLLLWIKGYLLAAAEIGDHVRIKTLTGRCEEGVLTAVNPTFAHTFGEFVPELLQIDRIVKTALWGGDENE